MFKCEQIVCSTWNNRRFSDSGRSGRRLGFRRSEVARERAAAPEKLEVPESLRRETETSSRCLNMNKLCVPRGTIEGFQIREGRGGGSDFGEVKLRGKEPPPPKDLED